jgi:hypothetical protein
MPIIFYALARRDGRDGIAWRDVGTPVIGVVDGKVVLDAAIKQRRNRLFTREELLNRVGALGRIRRAWKTAVASKQQRCVGIADNRVHRPVFVDIGPKLGRIGHVVVVVSVGLLAGRHQLVRRHRNVAGVKMRDVERVVEIVLRPAQARRLVERLERSGFDRGGRARRPVALLGDHRDNATNRVRAVKAALRATQHFELLDICGKQMSEVEGSVRRAGIADIDAVDQHFGVIGVGAAHEDRGLPARPSGLDHVQPRNGVQRVGHAAVLLCLDVLIRDHGDRTGNLAGWRHDTRRADDDG